MNLTDEKEKLLEFASKSQQNIFSEIDKSCTSYWQDENINECFMEKYEFETPMELMRRLSDFIEKKEIVKIITVASFKNQHIVARQMKANEDVGDEQLPEYVYNF